MSTYVKRLDAEDDCRCDAHSTFDRDGFPENGRAWIRRYGAPCVECGKDS